MIDIEGWLSQAHRVPSPNFNQRPANDQVSLLVIHNISLPPGQFGGSHIHQFFCNQLKVDADPYFREICELKVSAHVLIDRLGKVTQFVSFHDRAWHAGQSCFEGRENCNDFSIGIEMEGADEIPYTDAQYSCLVEIVNEIMAVFPGITPTRIVGHSHIAPGRKTDPGPAFDWQRLKGQLGS